MTAHAAADALPKQPFRLLVQGLAANDIAKVGAFLRFGNDRLRGDWSLVFSGEVHVMLLGSVEPHTVLGLVDNPKATLRLIDAPAGTSPSPGILVRPLQYEAFIDVLCELERVITGLPALPVVRSAPPAAMAASLALSPGARCRLRRWPPTALLQGGRYHQRLASFLSARHLDLAELARLSNVAPAQCEDFLNELIAAGLLDVKPADPASPPLIAPLVPRAAAAPAPAPSSPGLFGRIRRSLGLDWSK